MRFRTKVIEVEAMRLTESVKLGRSAGRAGDYLVDFPTGVALVAKKDFETRFESADAPIEAPAKRKLRRGGRKQKGTKAARSPRSRAPAAAALPAGRRKSPNDEKRAAARKMYEEGGVRELQVLADKFGVTYSTIWNWKQNDGWE